ncbi:MAG: hypothetical protein DRH79_06735 [Candidatus Cloacimonadota bacterium]|nr:MAG: hypothetical protein DRH79_06735 [Candidatus Cloacimonadota bacterium]
MKKLTLMIFTLCICAASALFAADGAWSASANGNWSDGGNWVGGTIADGAGSTAYFTNNVTYTVTVDTPRTIGKIVSENILHQFFPQLSGGPIILSGTPEINVADIPADNNFHAAIWTKLAGTEGFTKTGGGILALAWADNTISGTITVAEGILDLYNTANGHIPNITSIVVNSGAQLRIQHDQPIVQNPLILSGVGVAGHNGNNCGALYQGGADKTTIISNTVTVLTADTRIGGYCGGANNLYKLNGEITGPGGASFFAGGGATDHKWTFEIAGSNTYDGMTILYANFGAASEMRLMGPQRLPEKTLNMQCTWNADAPCTLDLNGQSQTVPSLEMYGAYTKIVEDSSVGGNGVITVNGTGENSLISAGTLLLEGGKIDHVDTYCSIRAGTTVSITGGTLRCSLETMIARLVSGNCVVNVSDSGILDTWAFRINDWGNATVNLITGGLIRTAQIYHSAESGAGPFASTFNFNGGTLSDAGWPARASFIPNDDNDYIVQAGGANIEIAGDKSIDDVLQHDATLGGTPDGGLTKLGAGTLIISNTCTYTGPTSVEAGKLVVNGDISSSSGITLAKGASIGGEGTLADLTVSTAATVAPGSSIGTLTSGNIAMEAGSKYDWEVGGGNADLLIATSLSLPGTANSVTVNVSTVGGVASTETNKLFETSGITGTPETAIVLSGAGTDSAAIVVDGNDILITGVVPEPATIGLLAILGLAFLRRK